MSTWRGWAPSGLLALTVGMLASGALLHSAGSVAAGDRVWMASGAVGACQSLWMSVASLRRGRVGVDVIALLALVGALGVGENLAASVIGVMVTTGQALEAWAQGRADRDLRSLLDRAPRSARRYEAGTLRTVPIDELVPGDKLAVGTGEVVPTDGTVLCGAVLDESALTGESLPVERATGDSVRSGVVNAAGALDMRVTAPASQSTYAGVVRLVSQARSSQAPMVRLADRYAVWFLLLSLLAGGTAWAASGVTRAVAVLVVATPCPLILAVPVAFAAGMSRASRRGVVVKGGGVLERLARCTTLLVDKTGTLTGGHPALAEIVTDGTVDQDRVLLLAGSLDQVSPHVLASALVRAAVQRCGELAVPLQVEEVPGRGIRGVVEGRRVAVGKSEWVGLTAANEAWAKAARRRARRDGLLTVFVAVDDRPVAVLLLDDPIRPDAAKTIRSLRRNGIQRIVMVTGDRPSVAESVGLITGVDEVLADRSPADKLDAVRAEQQHAPTVMVGDGINDAPALALADVGVAMGAGGATASSEAADVVLTVDRLDRLGEARAIAHRSRLIALQSIVAGMALSLAAMGVAAAGLLPAVWGALLQEGIDVAVILNALRAMRAPATEVTLAEADNEVTRRFQTEHVAVWAAINRIRAVADSLGALDPATSLTSIREVHRLLVEQIQPHEEAEQQILYPALERLLGGNDPTGPMSRAHVEITHQIRRLGHLLDEIGPEGPDDEEAPELRGLLYGLYAILRLHTMQEEESYLSLGDRAGTTPDGREASCTA